MEYCYKHEIDLSCDNVDAILIVASFLQMADLENACIKFYKKIMHASNCIGIWKIAEQYALQDLMSYSTEFTIRHLDKVVNCDEFAHLNIIDLGTILRNDDLKIDGEEEVFNTIIRWVQFDIEQRKSSFETLVRHVRFQYIRQSVSYILMISVEADKQTFEQINNLTMKT